MKHIRNLIDIHGEAVVAMWTAIAVCAVLALLMVAKVEGRFVFFEDGAPRRGGAAEQSSSAPKVPCNENAECWSCFISGAVICTQIGDAVTITQEG